MTFHHRHIADASHDIVELTWRASISLSVEYSSTQVLGKLTVGIYFLSDDDTCNFLTGAPLLKPGLLFIYLEPRGPYDVLKFLKEFAILCVHTMVAAEGNIISIA